MSGWRKRQINDIKNNLEQEKSFWKKACETYGTEGSFFRETIAKVLGLKTATKPVVCRQNTKKLK
jgi:hypothetical protein